MTSKLPEWLNAKGHQSDLVLSSRVRLARNLDSKPFPHSMTIEEKEDLLTSLEKTIKDPSFIQEVGEMTLYRLDGLSGLEREFLLEKHLISPDMLENYHNRGLVLGLDQRVSILINEEDHFRIQSFFSGLNLEEAYIISDKLDDALEKFYSYAYHEKYGYLTSCPTNVGTGIRFSVMLHLPALAMTNGLSAVQQILKNEGFVVRGFFGEGTEAYGNLYQISNQFTLGLKEEDIRFELERRIRDLIEGEKQARDQLFKQKPFEMENMIYRAYGTLKYGVLLTAKEGMNDVSLIRLGLERGLPFEEIMDYEMLNKLIVLAQPAGLQQYYNKAMSPEERDRMRPKLFKELLNLGGKENVLG